MVLSLIFKYLIFQSWCIIGFKKQKQYSTLYIHSCGNNSKIQPTCKVYTWIFGKYKTQISIYNADQMWSTSVTQFVVVVFFSDFHPHGLYLKIVEIYFAPLSLERALISLFHVIQKNVISSHTFKMDVQCRLSVCHFTPPVHYTGRLSPQQSQASLQGVHSDTSWEVIFVSRTEKNHFLKKKKLKRTLTKQNKSPYLNT